MSIATDVDIEHLRSWIGREETASDVLSIDLAYKFNATLDLSSTVPAAGDDAPLLIHYCLAQPVAPTDSLGIDGHPQRGGFLPPVPLPRRMWAGSRMTFHGDLKVGDIVQRRSRIADVTAKAGKSGPLCFVDVDHSFEVDGTLKIEERHTIVYRDAAASSRSSPASIPTQPLESAFAWDHTRLVRVSAPLLFRYSALTFNGHRIHYDRPYAMDVEHYPGLVFHGPLQATLLLNLATELRGKRPSKFSFRGLSPLFDDDEIFLHAAEVGNTVKLCTATANGAVATSAEAVW